MEKKSLIDIGVLAPIVLGVLSVAGILYIFFGRADVSRATGEPVSTETPFRFIYLGTEPGLSTLTPEPTATPMLVETIIATTTSTPTSALTNPANPTQPLARTPTITPTIQAVLKKVDDTYFELLYDGNWDPQSNVTGADQNTLHISSTIGNSVSFTFVGQQIFVAYQGGPSLGSIQITLDGLVLPPVSQSNNQTQLVEWRSPILIMGTHKIVIEHLSGGSINIDSITIPDLSTPVPPTSTPNPNV
ncbi:MAG TPA: hypothetical protein VIS72_00100 [Anaerolineales bacterium]